MPLNGAVETRFHALGRACHLVVGDRGGEGPGLLEVALAELRRIERHLGARSGHSVIHRINQLASPGDSVPLDREATQLFHYAEALHHKTGGVFDPGTRALSRLWKTRRPDPPAAEQVEAARARPGWRQLHLEEGVARIGQSGLLLGLNSCVCPYAADSLRRLLLSRGVESALIDLDGDVATIGRQADGSNWLVGLRYPRGARTAIHRLKLTSPCYSLRGNFEHRVQMDGANWGGALDPQSGYPLPGLLGVAVTADSCLEACAAATVARFREEQQGLEWLAGLALPWLAIDRQLHCHGPLATLEGLRVAG